MTACAARAPAPVFDPRAIPSPPAYSDAFKRDLAAEIEAAPARAAIVRVTKDAAGYYAQINCMKGKGPC